MLGLLTFIRVVRVGIEVAAQELRALEELVQELRGGELGRALLVIAQVVDQLMVYPERMRRNLEMTRGLVFSGQLLLDLTAAGMLRETAYRVVQRHAMEAWENDSDFRAAISSDPEITRVLIPPQIAGSFSLERQLRNVDRIFGRVFGDRQS